MKTHQILFSAPMVRALLDGRKTQTRRLLRLPDSKGESRRGPWEASTIGGPGVFTSAGEPFPERACVWHPKTGTCVLPPYSVGDLLWVRETWAVGACAAGLSPAMLSPRCWLKDNGGLWYAARGEPTHPISTRGRWRPGIHMPRWASRLTLAVTEVRVQRLQEISEADAVAEGCPGCLGRNPDFPDEWDPHPIEEFQELWTSINGKRPGASWSDNPWIVALTFKVHRANVDAMPTPAQREVAA